MGGIFDCISLSFDGKLNLTHGYSNPAKYTVWACEFNSHGQCDNEKMSMDFLCNFQCVMCIWGGEGVNLSVT